MKSLLLAAALTVLAVPALAQAPAAAPPILKIYSSAADVQALIAKLKSLHKADNVNTADVLANDPSYRVQIEYRTGTTPATRHDGQDELLYVIDGGCVMKLGGTLNGASGADNATIDGPELRKIAKGDFILVRSGTPHQFTEVAGDLILMAVHMPVKAP
jgi:mannose-6-phosphate isomerase-like protein (cupin superfamily)